MLTIKELSMRLAAYQSGNIGLDEFEDWFRDNSRGAYANRDISGICSSIEGAFSEFYFEGATEATLKQDLAAAIGPFEHSYSSRGGVEPWFIDFGGDPRHHHWVSPHWEPVDLILHV